MDGVRHGAPDESAAVGAVNVAPVVMTGEVREAVEQFAAFDGDCPDFTVTAQQSFEDVGGFFAAHADAACVVSCGGGAQ